MAKITSGAQKRTTEAAAETSAEANDWENMAQQAAAEGNWEAYEEYKARADALRKTIHQLTPGTTTKDDMLFNIVPKKDLKYAAAALIGISVGPSIIKALMRNVSEN